MKTLSISKKKLLNIFLVVLFISCSDKSIEDNRSKIDLELMEQDFDVFDIGIKLMEMSNGLHDLELHNNKQEILFVAVHGNRSGGYEWIYPLKVMNNKKNLISFYRWDDKSCINPSVNSLDGLVKNKLEKNKNIKKIILFGHSYGGLLVTKFMEQWDKKLPLEVHTIASPLKGNGNFIKMCEFLPPSRVPDNSELYEWRTIKKLDGIFKNLNYDPQNIEILGSNVTRLPETYKNNKLGHNWSLSWVADELNELNLN